MTLLNPWFLWLLIPLALLSLVRYREFSKSRLPLHPKVVLRNRRSVGVRLAPYLALAAMIVALARPVTVESTVVEAPATSTVYLAVDASASMRVTDRKPDRFTWAKRAVESLMAKDKAHKFALIAFTTNPLILTPPTEDREIVHAALESFNPDFILTHGTSIAALLRYVAKLGGERKEPVIFSDGGDSEDVAELARFARAHHIRIIGVAAATRRGGPVPSANGWLRDKEGRLVVSMQNPLLRDLAEATGGVYVDEADPDAAAEAVEEALERPEGQGGSEEVRYREWYWVPLLIGILFFLYGTLAMDRFVVIFKRLALPILALAGLQSQAGMLEIYKLQKGYKAYEAGRYEEAEKIFHAVKPPLLESTYALANTLYRQGAYKKAGRLYAACRSDDPAIKRRIWYNLGNCAAKLGRYKSAIDYYAKALALGEDNDTLANLKTVIFLEEKRRNKVQAKANKKVAAASRGGGAGERKKSGSSKSSQNRMQGSGSESASKTTRIGKQNGVQKAARRHPMSSKVYEMINKGYVNETRPW